MRLKPAHRSLKPQGRTLSKSKNTPKSSTSCITSTTCTLTHATHSSERHLAKDQLSSTTRPGNEFRVLRFTIYFIWPRRTHVSLLISFYDLTTIFKELGERVIRYLARLAPRKQITVSCYPQFCITQALKKPEAGKISRWGRVLGGRGWIDRCGAWRIWLWCIVRKRKGIVLVGKSSISFLQDQLQSAQCSKVLLFILATYSRLK